MREDSLNEKIQGRKCNQYLGISNDRAILSSIVVLFAPAFRASYPSGTEEVLRKTSSGSPHAPHQGKVPMNPMAVLGEMSKGKLTLPWPYAAASELLHQGQNLAQRRLPSVGKFASSDWQGWAPRSAGRPGWTEGCNEDIFSLLADLLQPTDLNSLFSSWHNEMQASRDQKHLPFIYLVIHKVPSSPWYLKASSGLGRVHWG